MSATLRELSAADIPWTLPPFQPEPADDDPLVAALLEAMSYRTLAQETLNALAALTVDYQKLRTRDRRLFKEWRTSCRQ